VCHEKRVPRKERKKVESAQGKEAKQTTRGSTRGSKQVDSMWGRQAGSDTRESERVYECARARSLAALRIAFRGSRSSSGFFLSHSKPPRHIR